MRFFYLTGVMMFLFASAAFAQMPIGLEVGAKAPDFEALNYNGENIRLSDFYQKGPVVLVFYRGGWCPYCNMHLQQFQSQIDGFNQYNTTVVAISVDQVAKAQETAEGKALGFEVISNPDASVLKDYNLVYQVPDELFKKYKEEYNIDLEAASGQTHHVIAVPATYLIDQTGTIIFGYANEDYKVRIPPEKLLEEVVKLQGSESTESSIAAQLNKEETKKY